MEDKKRAIKVDTLDELAEGFQESRGIADKLTMKQMIAFAKEPVGGGENKLLGIIIGDESLELTPEDLRGLTSNLPEYAFAYRTLKSVELPSNVTQIDIYGFYNSNIETIKTYATDFGDRVFYNGFNRLYFLSDTINSVGKELFYNANGTSGDTPHYIHFNNEAAYISFLRCALLTENVFLNIPQYYVYYGENEATEITMPADITTTGTDKARLFYKNKSIQKIKFLGDITFISTYTFYEASNLKEVDFTACTSVPTLEHYLNCFYHTHKDLKIKVPSALYDEWISATNWSYNASKIVAV